MRRWTEAAGEFGTRDAGVELLGALLIDLAQLSRRDIFHPAAIEFGRPLERRPRLIVVAVDTAEIRVAPRRPRQLERLRRCERAGDKGERGGGGDESCGHGYSNVSWSADGPPRVP